MQVALEALESDPISHAGLVTVLSPGKGTGLNYARASQKTAVSPDGGTGFIDGVWHGQGLRRGSVNAVKRIRLLVFQANQLSVNGLG